LFKKWVEEEGERGGRVMLESAFSAAFLSALARNALISNVFVETKAHIDPKKHLKIRIEAMVPTKSEVKSALARERISFER
jgi:hypothetical protein